jgi:hypothetical protein
VLGEQEFRQPDLGPEDLFVQNILDLTDASSLTRLTAATPPLPSSYVTVPEAMITTLPASWSVGVVRIWESPPLIAH